MLTGSTGFVYKNHFIYKIQHIQMPLSREQYNFWRPTEGKKIFFSLTQLTFSSIFFCVPFHKFVFL